MPVYKLAPIESRRSDPKWAASTLQEAVWVEARDDMDARHMVESATLKMVDFKPGKPMLFSPWVDDVVTSCWSDSGAKPPPTGSLLNAAGKTVKLP